MEKIKRYFERHKQQLQVLLFMFFSIFAFIAQLLSRLLCDLAFKGMTTPVTIWPFPKQALGSFLAFLISNIIARARSIRDKKVLNGKISAITCEKAL